MATMTYHELITRDPSLANLHPDDIPGAMYERPFCPVSVGQTIRYAEATGTIIRVCEREDEIMIRVRWDDGDETNHDAANLEDEGPQDWLLVD